MARGGEGPTRPRVKALPCDEEASGTWHEARETNAIPMRQWRCGWMLQSIYSADGLSGILALPCAIRGKEGRAAKYLRIVTIATLPTTTSLFSPSLTRPPSPFPPRPVRLLTPRHSVHLLCNQASHLLLLITWNGLMLLIHVHKPTERMRKRARETATV